MDEKIYEHELDILRNGVAEIMQNPAQAQGKLPELNKLANNLLEKGIEQYNLPQAVELIKAANYLNTHPINAANPSNTELITFIGNLVNGQSKIPRKFINSAAQLQLIQEANKAYIGIKEKTEQKINGLHVLISRMLDNPQNLSPEQKVTLIQEAIKTLNESNKPFIKLNDLIKKIVTSTLATSNVKIYEDILLQLITAIETTSKINLLNSSEMNKTFLNTIKLCNQSDQEKACNAFLKTIINISKTYPDISANYLLDNIKEFESKPHNPFLSKHYIETILENNCFGHEDLFNYLKEQTKEQTPIQQAFINAGYTVNNLMCAGIRAGLVTSKELTKEFTYPNAPHQSYISSLLDASISAKKPDAIIIKQVISKLDNPLTQKEKGKIFAKLKEDLTKNTDTNPRDVSPQEKQLSALAFEIENPNYAMRFLLNEIVQNAKQNTLQSLMGGHANTIPDALQESSYDEFKECLQGSKEDNKFILNLLKEKENLHGKDVLKSAYESARNSNITKIHPENGYQGLGKVKHYLECALEELSKIFGKVRNLLTENVQHTIIDFKSVQSNLGSTKKELLGKIQEDLKDSSKPTNVLTAARTSIGDEKQL